jgi:hypothetical protein
MSRLVRTLITLRSGGGCALRRMAPSCSIAACRRASGCDALFRRDGTEKITVRCRSDNQSGVEDEKTTSRRNTRHLLKRICWIHPDAFIR